jgi:hypothetical protein
VGEATALLDAAERLLGSAGVKRAPGEGVEELGERLLREAHPAGAPLEQLTRRYLEARFGSRPLAEGERAALLAPLKQALERTRRPAALRRSA